jgi:hypothetical protein
LIDISCPFYRQCLGEVIGKAEAVLGVVVAAMVVAEEVGIVRAVAKATARAAEQVKIHQLQAY